MALAPVVVLGATGRTGRLVCRELEGRGVPFLPAGRDARRLEALAAGFSQAQGFRVVAAPGPAPAGGPFWGARVVVNCLAPLARWGEWVVEKAVAGRVCCVDPAGEQSFLRRVHAAYDGAARSAGVTVVNALAYEYALGDAAARLLLAGTPQARALDVLYCSWGSASSRGTKQSVLHVLTGEGVGYEDGRWVPVPLGRFQRRFTVQGRTLAGVSFPGGEILSVPRHSRVQQVRTYLAVPRPLGHAVRPLAALLGGWRGRALLPILERLVARVHREPPAGGRPQGGFLVYLEAAGEAGTRGLLLGGRDTYGITAALLAEGAVRLLAAGAPAGVRSCAEAFDPAEFLQVMEARWPSLRRLPLAPDP